ncbi:MAG: orotate phosphoribosyltransferase [bacterium]
MTTDDVLKEFEECGALLKGHFVLSSGLHSDTYLNKSIVSMYADRTETLCRALAEKIQQHISTELYAVISPAMGGIIYGYETSRHLHLPFMFTERVEGEFKLRRGFAVPKGAPVVIVEDIVSTGLSARECVEAVRAHGGEPQAVACLIDRSAGGADIGVPILPLAQIKVEAWPADDLPEHLQHIPAVKPGSRGIA